MPVVWGVLAPAVHVFAMSSVPVGATQSPRRQAAPFPMVLANGRSPSGIEKVATMTFGTKRVRFSFGCDWRIRFRSKLLTMSQYSVTWLWRVPFLYGDIKVCRSLWV